MTNLTNSHFLILAPCATAQAAAATNAAAAVPNYTVAGVSNSGR